MTYPELTGRRKLTPIQSVGACPGNKDTNFSLLDKGNFCYECSIYHYISLI